MVHHSGKKNKHLPIGVAGLKPRTGPHICGTETVLEKRGWPMGGANVPWTLEEKGLSQLLEAKIRKKQVVGGGNLPCLS